MSSRVAIAVLALGALVHAGGPGAQNDVSCDGTVSFNTIDLLGIINATATGTFQQSISNPL